MPQEHHVLKCFSCETFQAHIVKKVRKWECKMCGAKQSLKRSYGKGTGKDCRMHVMRLNELRITKGNSCQDEMKIEDEIFEENSTDYLEKQEMKEIKGKERQSSKWDEYLEDNQNDCKSEDEEEPENFFLVTEKKKKRTKKSTEECYNKKKKICLESSICEVFSEPDKETVPLFSNVEEKLCNDQGSPVKTENKLQKSKYSKYIEEEGEEDDLIQNNKYLNIFDSEPADLDNILNFD